jgi:hypothetical protein
MRCTINTAGSTALSLEKRGSRFGPTMQIVILCIVLTSWSLTSCGLLVPQSEKLLQEAKAGLDRTVATVPRYEEYELVHTSEELFSSRINDWADGPCKYARVFSVYGTDNLSIGVLERYYQDLSEQGWETEDTLASTNWSLLFERSAQERIVIEALGNSNGEPGPYVQGIIGYDIQIPKKYATFVVVRVDYVIPQIKGC